MAKILIVEDDSFLQGLMARKFTTDGYTILTASDGETAVQIADKEIPNLVLLDLMLPKMDGFEVLEKIKKNASLAKTPVIVFSNMPEDKDITRAKALGALDYMIKSNFTLDELEAKINSFIPKK